MIFAGFDHVWIHNLMRPLPYKPYFIFPAKERAHAVYIPSAPPKLLLVDSESYYTLKYNRKDRKLLKALEERFAPLAAEGQELTNRMGCPVACVFIMENFEEQSWKTLLEMAKSYRITLVISGYEWPKEFIWNQPAVLNERPSLPPYPTSWQYSIAHRLDWWHDQISTLEKLEGHERKKHAKYLFPKALEYLKESPARMLVEGTKALEIACEFLPRFPSLLTHKVGHRYVYWLSFYFAAVCVIGRTITAETDALVYDFLQYLMQSWPQASSQEKRLILRGLELLAEKSATYLLPADSPVVKFFHGLFPWAIEQFKAKEAIGWGFEWRVINLIEKLGLYGYISPSMIENEWKQSTGGKFDTIAIDGVIDYFMLHPSREMWRTLFNNLPKETLKSHIRWRLFENWWSEEFWQLAAEDEDLLKLIVGGLLIDFQQSFGYHSRTFLTYLIALLEQREVSLGTYTREEILQKLKRIQEDDGVRGGRVEEAL